MMDLNASVREVQALLDEAEHTYNTDRQRAITLAEQSLELSRRQDDDQALAQALDLVGNVRQSQGRLSDAHSLFEEGLQIRQALDDKIGIGLSFRNLGGIARWRGEFDQAETFVRQSLSIFDELHDVQRLSQTAVRLHGVFVYGGRFEQSARLFEEPGTLYQEFELLDRPETPSIVSAFALMHLGRYEEAKERFQITVFTNPRAAIGYAIKNLGRIALQQGKFDEAQKHLHEALALFRETGDVNGLGQTLGCLGMLELRLRNLDQARTYIDENVEIAADTLVILPSLTALSSLALLRIEENSVETAIELYAAASTAGHVANSIWYRDVVGRPIAKASESLAPKTIASAKERGEGTLWRAKIREL